MNSMNKVPLRADLVEPIAGLSGKALAAELNKRALVREEKLASLLLERNIASVDDLIRALHKQEHREQVKLGDLLVDAGVITPVQLAEALIVQGMNRERRLGDVLVDMGLITVRLAQMALADKLGVPFVDVRSFPVDPLALEAVGPAIATRYGVLPLARIGDALAVAVENPLAPDFAQDLQFVTRLSILPVIANPDDLRARIAKEYSSLESPAGAGRQQGLAQTRVEDLANALELETPLPRDARDNGSEARITDNALVRLMNKIIVEAHAQGASDIHIENNAGDARTRIRFRKDGEMEDYLELQPAYRNALVSRVKVMAGLDISEHRHAQDGKIGFANFGPLPIELRVAVVPTSNNLEDVVLRILGGVEPLPLDALGMEQRDLEAIHRMVQHSWGLILVCGPTGSGKTTTLHSILHDINRPDLKIWTAEDPVEITQAGLRQVQINAHVGWTFAAAMRAFLRADPDVIMVGEMRDAETTKIGIEASLTGHLVFSTLHTNSAAESVVRLLELGMDPFNFADALIGILSQRLARKLCVQCRKPRPATDAEVDALALEYCAGSQLEPAAVVAQWHRRFDVDGHLLLHDACGCAACSGGYKGRIGIYELLTATPQVKQLIRVHGSVPELQGAALQGGMRLLRQDAIEKVLAGVLDLASAKAASS
jgi:type II secretory ATPase GspE/PulE/Tfp pilus assembly ATPase PilB-like protein